MPILKSFLKLILSCLYFLFETFSLEIGIFQAESGPSTPKRRKTSTSSSAEKASKENKEEGMEVDETTQNSAATGTSGSPDKDESQVNGGFDFSEI